MDIVEKVEFQFRSLAQARSCYSQTRQSLIRAILLLVSRLSPVISWSPELSAAVLRAHQPRPDVSALCALWRLLPRSRTEEMDNTLLTDMLVST